MVTILLTVFTWVAPASAADLADSYLQATSRVQEMDVESRQVMSSLYEINSRMKKISKRRDNLNDQLIAAEADVTALAKSIADLEDHIKEQRLALSRRLRAMYMIGNEGVARVLFSSASSLDLDQSLKYLKLISEHDLSLIKSFRQNLVALAKKRERLNRRVSHLLGIQHSLKSQEDDLAHSQESKAEILRKLSSDRRRTLEKLAVIRGRAGDPELLGLINLSFFEHKGQLAWPVRGNLAKGFGTIKNEVYRYTLSHKGFDFKVGQNKEVKSIFSGQVAFSGDLPGYEKTLIVDHGDHFYSVYAGLTQVRVDEGESVKEGQVVATAANNVYFEIRHFSDAIDPKPWLNKEMTVKSDNK
jgi:septal ring factor EnvC (AmiA/AmiB activator)